jgi:hypothetical protein
MMSAEERSQAPKGGAPNGEAFSVGAPSGAPAKKLVEYVETFNGTIKRLTADLAARFPTDATIWRVKERVLLAIDQWPMFIIEQVGPYLYRYQEQIYAGNEAFFLDTDYDQDLRKSVDQGRAELAAYIIPKAKEAAKGLNAEERAEYHQMAQDMLDDYIEFLAGVKIDGKK